SSLVADEIPDRIKALALYYPAYCIPDDWRKQFPEGSEIPETMNFWGLDLGKKFFEVATALHVEECTGKYTGPVLIIHGTQDNIVPLSYAQDAQKRFPNAQLEIFEGEGHGFSPQAGYKARDLVLAHAKKALGL
ncbi:MAG: alpha/beta hydrolase, partial [Treponema sp.]|nr:alpha/beta hydrolase [Treponema sp.]